MLKSIIKIKLAAITHPQMKRVVLKKTITCEGLDFIDKVIPSISINSGTAKLPEYTHTAKEQANEWLSNQSQILDGFINDLDNELHCILDWQIISVENVNSEGITSLVVVPQPKKEKLSEAQKMQCFAELAHKEFPAFNEKLKNDFLHAYQEMSESLKGISTERQIHLVFAAIGIGYKAATVALSDIITFGKYMDSNRGKINFSKTSAKDIRALMEAEKTTLEIE